MVESSTHLGLMRSSYTDFCGRSWARAFLQLRRATSIYTLYTTQQVICPSLSTLWGLRPRLPPVGRRILTFLLLTPPLSSFSAHGYWIFE